MAALSTLRAVRRLAHEARGAANEGAARDRRIAAYRTLLWSSPPISVSEAARIVKRFFDGERA